MTSSKVLIVCPFVKPNLGGVESHIDKLTSYLISRHVHPVIVTYQPLTRKAHGPSREVHPDHEIIRQSWFGNGWFNKLEKCFPLQFLYLFPGLFFRSLIYYHQNYQEIHCIHAHGLTAAVVTRLLQKVHSKRIVVSTHAIYQLSHRPVLAYLVKTILKPFDRILTVSRVSLDEIRSIGIPPDQLSVHPNWVDTSIFKPTKIHKNGLNLLFVGRLIEKKGIRLFLEAATQIPQANFHIIGDGPADRLVETFTKNHRHIQYYGSLSSFEPQSLKKIVRLYNLADFLVSPYLYDEGYSTVLLESLACGTPVIVTNRGSPPTFLSSKVCHLLPPNPTTHDLVQLINQITAGKAKIISRRQCRNFAQTQFGPNNADIILESYSL